MARNGFRAYGIARLDRRGMPKEWKKKEKLSKGNVRVEMLDDSTTVAGQAPDNYVDNYT